jgi:cytidine deaminase
LNFTLTTNIKVYQSIEDLNHEDLELMNAAHKISKDAYAPYSNFYVGAAIRMDNGEICVGNNQENAAYPSGICAERVAIFSASAMHPNLVVKKIAVVAHSNQFLIDKPVSPCGSCRQVLAEYESKFKSNIKLLMMGETGKVYEIDSIKEILPLMFTAEDLLNK